MAKIGPDQCIVVSIRRTSEHWCTLVIRREISRALNLGIVDSVSTKKWRTHYMLHYIGGQGGNLDIAYLSVISGEKLPNLSKNSSDLS